MRYFGVKDIKIYLFIFLISFIYPTFSYAAQFLQSTLSSGYYKDVEQESHLPAYFYWNLGYISRNGFEGHVHFGVNNNLIQDLWKAYLYHATFSIPLSQGFEEAPYRKSKIQIGRQLFLEGFETGLLDGVNIPLYWSSKGGMTFVAGGLHTLEKHNFDFDSQIYGGLLHQQFLEAQWKIGYFFHFKDNNVGNHLVEGNFLKEWQGLPLKPSLFLRGQMKIPKLALFQGLSELELVPIETIVIQGGLSSLERSSMTPEDGSFIYRLFSLTSQKTRHLSFTWFPLKSLQLETILRRIYFKSSSKRESANQQEIGFKWTLQDWSLRSFLGHMDSFGGDVWHGGGDIRKSLNSWAKLRLEMDMAKIDKINDISTWAYHGRGGFDFKLASRFLVSTLAELERNHIFEVDSRAIVYVSHYLY